MRRLLIVSVLFTVQFSLLYFGLTKTNASRATLLINLQPFFVLVLAHCFVPGDRITKRKSLGLLLGFTGMASVFLGKEGVTTDVQIGDFSILISAFLWACNRGYSGRRNAWRTHHPQYCAGIDFDSIRNSGRKSEDRKIHSGILHRGDLKWVRTPDPGAQKASKAPQAMETAEHIFGYKVKYINQNRSDDKPGIMLQHKRSSPKRHSSLWMNRKRGKVNAS
jgi:hypothetical protein